MSKGDGIIKRAPADHYRAGKSAGLREALVDAEAEDARHDRTPATLFHRLRARIRARIAALEEAADISGAFVAPPYPEGRVVGPCVCGSWPGGGCLRCAWTADTKTAESITKSIRALIGTDPTTDRGEG